MSYGSKTFYLAIDVPATSTKPARAETVELTINFGSLAQSLCLDACKNKSGKAVIGSGAVTARVKRSK